MTTSSIATLSPSLPTNASSPAVKLPTPSPNGVTPFQFVTEKIVSDKNVDITVSSLSRPAPSRDGKIVKVPVVLIIETGDGADDVHISKGPGGQLNALINGKSYLLPVENSGTRSLVIRTNKGNDKVVIDPDVRVTVKIHGGAGNDYIQTGGGTSYVFGGADDDTVKLGSATSYAEGNDGDDLMIGGRGNHVMYGGNGKDHMYGGDGPEGKTSYMDGGNDDDNMYGGSGHNIMHGGTGNNSITAYGRSTIYTGRGHASVYSRSRNDVVYGKRSDNLQLPFGFKFIETVPLPSDAGRKALKTEGTPEFKQRMEDDLELYRSSPAGQRMLKDLDAVAQKNGASITIKESDNDEYEPNDVNSTETPLSTSPDPSLIHEGSRGSGVKEASIGHDPKSLFETNHESPALLPPIIGLHHEMAHAYNGATGSMFPGSTEVKNPDGTSSEEDNAERQAVGVESDVTPFDFDNDPSTPPTTLNPYPLTENGLREEMGLPLRKGYADI